MSTCCICLTTCSDEATFKCCNVAFHKTCLCLFVLYKYKECPKCRRPFKKQALSLSQINKIFTQLTKEEQERYESLRKDYIDFITDYNRDWWLRGVINITQYSIAKVCLFMFFILVIEMMYDDIQDTKLKFISVVLNIFSYAVVTYEFFMTWVFL